MTWLAWALVWAAVACLLGLAAGRLLHRPEPDLDAAILAAAEEFRAELATLPCTDAIGRLLVHEVETYLAEVAS